MPMARLFAPFAVALGLAAPALAADPTVADAEFFEKRVRPVLVEHCFKCHGGKGQKGGLRVNDRAALLAGGDSGPALVPGDPAKSKLIEAVRYDNPDLLMPPKGKLPAAAVADLEAWVKAGAVWPGDAGAAQAHSEPAAKAFDLDARRKDHWAWQPVRPQTPPVVRNPAWPADAVDRFLLAKLEAKGLTPAGPADKPTWLRRVTFALTGLPPTPADLAAYQADASPEAAAAVVDRLLASSAFGERWGRHWLDLVRYAESRGQVGSNSRARSSGSRPERTRSTIWRRNSGEYGGRDLGIGNTSDESFRVSTKPGQSQPLPSCCRSRTRRISSSTAAACHRCCNGCLITSCPQYFRSGRPIWSCAGRSALLCGRRSRRTFLFPNCPGAARRRRLGIGATSLVLLGSSAAGIQLGLPTAIAGAVTAIVVLVSTGRAPWPTLKGISWAVLPLVAGLFVLVEALGRSGLIRTISTLLHEAAQRSAAEAAWGAGVVLAFATNLMNNLPAGLIAGNAVRAAHGPERVTRAVLIGVDLGPNLSVTGSLATILWLTALRREGHKIGAWTFLKLGILVMPPALILAIAAAVMFD